MQKIIHPKTGKGAKISVAVQKPANKSLLPTDDIMQILEKLSDPEKVEVLQNVIDNTLIDLKNRNSAAHEAFLYSEKVFYNACEIIGTSEKRILEKMNKVTR